MVIASQRRKRGNQPVLVADGSANRGRSGWRERHRMLEFGAVGLLVVYALSARMLVAMQLLPWQGPDEPKHFEYVRLLIDMRSTLWNEHRLLRLEDAPGYGADAQSPAAVVEREVIASMSKHDFWKYAGPPGSDAASAATFFDVWQGSGTQLHRASVYYFLAAPVVAPFLNAPIEQQLLAVRTVSSVLGALAVVVAYATGRMASRNDAFVSVIASAFVATLPMSVFLGGNVNIDNLATLVGGLVALGVARGATRGFDRLTWLLMLGGSALGLATKREFFGVLPAVGLVALVWAFRNRSLISRRVFVIVGSLLALLPVIGIWSGTAGRLVTAVSDYALNESDQAARLLQPPLSLAALEDLLSFQWGAFFASFWGIFGWFTVRLSPPVYAVFNVAMLLSVVGVAIVIARTRSPALRWLIGVYSLMIATMTILAFGIALSYFSSSTVPQGRQIFGVLVPIAVLFALGARAWLPARYVGTAIPTALLVLLLLSLDGAAYVQSFAPTFLRARPS